MAVEKVGAAWVKESNSGTTWMSISMKKEDLQKILTEIEGRGLQKANLGLFENTKKTAENQPDYNLLFLKPKEA